MDKTKILLCITLIITVSDAYKILGLFPLNVKSHMVIFERLMKGLADKGHEVDVLTAFPQKTAYPRYTELSVENLMRETLNNLPMAAIKEKMSSTYDTVNFIINDMGVNLCSIIFNTTVAQNLKMSEKKYDLVISETFGSDCMLGFAYHFKVPSVTMISSVVLPWASDRIGIFDNPSYIPNYFTSYSSQMTFFERMFNTVTLVLYKLQHSMTSPETNIIARAFFDNQLPDIEELARNTSLILVNSHLSVNYARPTVPNFIEVGGLHIQAPKPLPNNLQNALNISHQYKGVIYLSMGSMVMTETFDIHKLEALFQAFSELPYKVIWKANKEIMPTKINIPKNIEFFPWLPQVDILCHPNVKLFVSHGGLLGSQESIYCGIPRLGIPLFADQESNLKQSVAMGLAIMIKYNSITKENVLQAASTLLYDTKYKNNSEHASQLFKDRPMAPLETAIFWIEYVIRQNGAPHLRTVGTDLPENVVNTNMKTFVLIVCISVQILLVSAKILPKSFPTFCSKSEPNYNKCMENALHKMSPYLLKGIKAIKFPKLHPLTIPSFSVDRKLSENIFVQSELKNMVVYGYDKMELKKFDFDPNELTGKVVLYIPHLDFKTEYDTRGQLINFNITSEGFVSGNSTGLDLEFDIKLKKINKIGTDYLTVDKFVAKGAVQDSRIKLIARDPANQRTSDFISTFFNEHAKELLEMVDPIYEECLGVYYASFLEKFLFWVPANEIIPE